MNILRKRTKFSGIIALAFAFLLTAPIVSGDLAHARPLTANVVAFDMPLMWNRLGPQNINGMMFALRRNVVVLNATVGLGGPIAANTPLSEVDDADLAGLAGNVTLRPDMRPRPLVLRTGAGDTLAITLTNLLAPARNPFAPPEVRSGIDFNLLINDQVVDRRVSLRFQGTELVGNISDDGSFVGGNASSLLDVGQTTTYNVRTPYENAYVGTSYGATTGGEGLGGNTANGLWAVLNVNPVNSAFYRSQLTEEEMRLAATDLNPASPTCGAVSVTADGHPIIDYEARYPLVNCNPAPAGTGVDLGAAAWIAEGKAGLPIINMVDGGEIVHSDINAIIAYGPSFMMIDAPDGPYQNKLGHFPEETYPLESQGHRNPTVPNRLEPFREFTIAFHDEVTTKQAYPLWYEDPVLKHTLHGVRDSFMINYGSGGIGTEIISSRLRVGPMHDCINCAYEEFFLTFFTVGEVGQLTDIPANLGLEDCEPTLAVGCTETGPKATKVLFPDDPSNVHHSYTGDFVKFRNIHAGPGEQHIFHLHNHQWLWNANDDNSNYLDAQGIGPGSGYTYEINFGGSGNRNKTAGDAIFHCHFYPHFAQGMWEMWRVHDTHEIGTELAVSAAGGGFHAAPFGLVDGTPGDVSGDGYTRALPDSEVIAGAPTPAIVPLPDKAMAPMPDARVTVKVNDNQVCVGPAPLFGLQPRNPDGTCPAGTALRNTGSLTDLDDMRDVSGDLLFDAKNPGYPFWIAGMEHTVGQRPTTPPLDMITSAKAEALVDSGNPLFSVPDGGGGFDPRHPGFTDPASVQGFDGGLPRFTLGGYSTGGESIVSLAEPRLDLSKEITKAKPHFFPEEGTQVEQLAMAYHAEREHSTYLPDGTSGVNFITNGQPPVPGAPFQEPCLDDVGVLLSNVSGTGINSTTNGSFFGGDDYSDLGTNGYSPFDADSPRVYKAANVQFDAVFNKIGYHFPQERIITLWQDVEPTINKTRAPEPFVLRINTFDCTQYVHSNVVPKTYEVDDYQVRTPTDIIGQHIHLPKWDLTTADGAANGWNYEDGTLSPGMVREVIEAINTWTDEEGPVLTDVEGNPVTNSEGTAIDDLVDDHLVPLNHPFFGTTAFNLEWKGARSTMQRWFADPVVNIERFDRGLGIIFTHDHYGPSTHQQIGLYATVLIEPAGSKWVHNETGTTLYTRTGSNPGDDGGPTSWQAAILTGVDGIGGYNENVGAERVESHREFYYELSDFQHAYQPGVYVGAGADGFPLAEYQFSAGLEILPGQFLNSNLLASQGDLAPDQDTFRDAIQPSFRQQAPLVNGFPVDIWEFPPFCPGDNPLTVAIEVPRPCPEAISADDPGMYVVNYRNESLMARVYDPNRPGLECPDGRPGCQATGDRGDLAFALHSRTDRAIPELNTQLGLAPATYDDTPGPVFLPAINQLTSQNPGDPFTPMARTFRGDLVKVKIQTGATEEEHVSTFHGLKWMQAGSGFGVAKNSGWRNAQSSGISEQFSFRTPIIPDIQQTGNRADHLWAANASFDGYTTGIWGILRNYSNKRNDLYAIPGNDPGDKLNIVNDSDFDGVCREEGKGKDREIVNLREYDVVAVLAEDVLPVPAGVTVQDLFPGTHAGRAPNGGTLVYNSRPDPVAPTAEARGGDGPLHDPTAILYFYREDLDFDPAGVRTQFGDPIGLQPGVPVEPLVIRANAGDCIQTTLHNALLAQATTIALDTITVIPVVDTGGNPVFEDVGQPLFADLNQNGIIEENACPDGNPPVDDGTGTLVCSDLSAPFSEQVAAATVAFDDMPDLASGNALIAMVRRDPGLGAAGMTSFNNNLIKPSAIVGLHPGLVEYDVTRSDGTVVGLNNPGQQIARPGEKVSYQWYAGHIDQVIVDGPKNRINVEVVETPIEYGGFTLMGADKLKQPQKGMVGAGVIYPPHATWTATPDDTGTNMSRTIDVPENDLPAYSFRDFTTVWQKGHSMHYADSYPVENILGEGSFGVAEDAQEMGHSAINYGVEPLWFRFGLNPTDAAGFILIPNAGDAYSNGLAGGAFPDTPVFEADPFDPFRMHVLLPAGSGRGSTYDLHGHVWQRDPYVCPGEDDGEGLPGKCETGDGDEETGSVGSQRLAGIPHIPSLAENPIGFELGGIESVFPSQHYEIVIPSAGGANGIPGYYLFRDHMGLGNIQGLWGIVHVD